MNGENDLGRKRGSRASTLVAALLLAAAAARAHDIPLPEHPRPDFERAAWLNLNGPWQFRFDRADEGSGQGWQKGEAASPSRSRSRFPGDRRSPAFPTRRRSPGTRAASRYRRRGRASASSWWSAPSDWKTTAWLDGTKLGDHEGGYTPFEFELTKLARPGHVGAPHAPSRRRGPHVQARGQAGLRQRPRHLADALPRGAGRCAARDAALHAGHRREEGDGRGAAAGPGAQGPDAAPRVPHRRARRGGAPDPQRRDRCPLRGGGPRRAPLVALGSLPLRSGRARGGRRPSPRRRPHLLRHAQDLRGEPAPAPTIATSRSTTSRSTSSSRSTRRTTREGFYTFPSDEVLRNELLRARQIGLNGLREHVKVESPRKLYWADRLGVLIMADVPNSWGEPDAGDAAGDRAHAAGHDPARLQPPVHLLLDPLQRDLGPLHESAAQPGEKEPKKVYEPETQEWVASVYRLAKSLDPTRLVEDNSVCCERGHTETDINSWHAYLPGWAWDEDLDKASKGTATPARRWNFEAGYKQDRQPNINSEFGNVWGYEGSTGDVDWSWDYHRAVNSFRRHPEGRGLALHRAPRRHQRVERLLALRPLGEVHRARGPRRRA